MSLTAKFACKFTYFACCAYTAYISYLLFPSQPKEGRGDFPERQADWPRFSEACGQLVTEVNWAEMYAAITAEHDEEGTREQLAAGWKKWLAQQNPAGLQLWERLLRQ